MKAGSLHVYGTPAAKEWEVTVNTLILIYSYAVHIMKPVVLYIPCTCILYVGGHLIMQDRDANVE